MILYTIYASAFITPEFTCVIILFFLFQVPIVLIDESWRINLFEISMTLLYLLCILPFKERVLVPDEILNTILFYSVGIVLGEYMRKAKLDNYELTREAFVRERLDYLTGLGNRRSLIESLEKETDIHNIAIIMLDVDNFKRYNDTYGHIQGDACLKEVCSCLKMFGATKDTEFFRYGGEEFVGIMRNATKKDIEEICKQMHEEVFALQIPHEAVERKYVTVSIGVAMYDEQMNQNYIQLLKQADIAVYQKLGI